MIRRQNKERAMMSGLWTRLLSLVTYLVFTKVARCLKNTLYLTVPLGDWLEKKKVAAIIIKQQFGFPISTT